MRDRSTRTGVAEKCQLAFLALPHVNSMEAARELRRRGMRVIDLSADYRLKNAQVYADWYDHAHIDPEGLSEAVYGLPEIYRDHIPSAALIANPGCYTSTSILALAPLIADEPDRANGDHHRRQERRLGRRSLAEADDPFPRNATRAWRPTTWDGIATRPRSTRC